MQYKAVFVIKKNILYIYQCKIGDIIILYKLYTCTVFLVHMILTRSPFRMQGLTITPVARSRRNSWENRAYAMASSCTLATHSKVGE